MARSGFSKVLLFGGLVLLSGCGWLGESEGPPLPGDRISVLTRSTGLEADPEAAGETIDLPRAHRNADWSQAGGDTTHAPRHLELDSSLSIDWRTSVGRGSSSERRLLAQPVSEDGVVYTLDASQQVSAISLANGRRLWRRDLGTERSSREEFFGGGVAVGEEHVYATTGFGGLFALNKDDGEIAWESGLGAPVHSAPTAADGRVYVVTTANRMVALDGETGNELWSYTGLEEMAGLVGGASPAVEGSTAVAAFSSGQLVAFLAENGQVLWEDSLAGIRRAEQTANLVAIRGHPVMDQGMVLAISNSNLMLAIDQRTGMSVWERTVGSIHTPWVSGDTIYVVTNDSQLAALRRNDGRVRWAVDLQRYRDPEEREGRVIWTGPVLAGERLVLANSLGQLVSFSPTDGSVQDSRSLPGPVLIEPAVVDGTLLLLTDSGELLALR